jgi:catechol 2,3-dioxygenase-like lactoylglutathione lyase family enzyme
MSDKVSPIPKGYEGITPYLICRNAEAAIEFYKRAFGAEELYRVGGPGMVGHAEMKIGNAIFMMADEFPPMAMSPESVGGGPVLRRPFGTFQGPVRASLGICNAQRRPDAGGDRRASEGGARRLDFFRQPKIISRRKDG